MFLHLNQNNSGGYFLKDEENGISEDIIIECDTAKEGWAYFVALEEKVSELFEYCGCSGERWHNWLDDEDLTEKPCIYDEDVESVKKTSFREVAYIHFKDGTIKKYVHKD